MKKNDDPIKIARYMSDFLDSYAPSFLTTSEHTLKSCRDAIGLYVGFLENSGVTPEILSRKHFEKEWIEKWIMWMKETRRCSPDTCNVRLGSLRMFLQYLGSRDLCFRCLYQEVIAETYPKLHELLRPLSQDDIDEALCTWNGDMDSRRAESKIPGQYGRNQSPERIGA